MAEVQTPNPDASILVGGPLSAEGGAMPANGEVHPDLKKPVVEKAKYELNGKSFDSAEDMSKYVADLERKLIEIPAPQQVVVPAQNNKPLYDGMTLDQLLFANPERYTQVIQEQAERKLDQKIAMQEYKKTFWSDFYKNNPDLRGNEEVVEAFVAKNYTPWSNLKDKEYAKVVADTSRSALKRAGAFKAVEVLPGEAAALSASGSTTTQVEKPRAATSFVDEMKIRELKRRSARVR